MRRTKEDAQQTRERLIDAAEQVFAERGVSRTTLQEIAKAAGLTRGAIYWHFKDKAELFNAMMARTTLPMEDNLKAIDTANEAQPLARLKASMLDALRSIAEDPRVRRVFDIATLKVEYVDDLMGVRARHLDVHTSCRSHIEATFRRAQALDHLPAQPEAKVMAVGYLGLINGLIHNWMLDPVQFDLVDVAAQSVEVFFQGLRQA